MLHAQFPPAAGLPALALAALLLSCATAPPAPVRAGSEDFDRCDACHPRRAEELRDAAHFHHAIRCVTCHGHSTAHAARPTAAPDDVFSRAKVDPLCRRCHRDECRHAQTDRPVPPGAGRQTCADCHGAHAVRVVPATPGVVGRGAE